MSWILEWPVVGVVFAFKTMQWLYEKSTIVLIKHDLNAINKKKLILDYNNRNQKIEQLKGAYYWRRNIVRRVVLQKKRVQ